MQKHNRSGYNAGCRCGVCRAANRDHSRRHRERSPYVRKPSPYVRKPCTRCGIDFISTSATRKYCTDCSNAAAKESMARSAARRVSPRGPTVPCSICGDLRPQTAGSLPEGKMVCHSCRRDRQKPKPALPDGWHCELCGEWSDRAGRTVGKYCSLHSGKARPSTCQGCGLQFVTPTRRIYCSRDCKRSSSLSRKPEPQVRSTRLTWKQCICGIWICKPGKKYCNAECSKEASAIRQGWRNRKCSQCHVGLGYRSLNSLCDECRTANKRDRKHYRHRARHHGVEYEPVNRAKVYERDNWLCGICGLKVDKRLKYPHLMSASLDHVIPVSLGGGHLYVNVQCSHLVCNRRKSNTGSGDQLALIG